MSAQTAGLTVNSRFVGHKVHAICTLVSWSYVS